ncbi:hypothetical protein TIFTF001_005621 [Ficus carica]|uniref:Uncharacterized protein n=1 Tax=Ficus carica TaxID=3494 RepID=A0AA88CZM7_FICCA|nr:hypothetical protein TIFTF001_005621 [Ficus carica]
MKAQSFSSLKFHQSQQDLFRHVSSSVMPQWPNQVTNSSPRTIIDISTSLVRWIYSVIVRGGGLPIALDVAWRPILHEITLQRLDSSEKGGLRGFNVGGRIIGCDNVVIDIERGPCG